MVGIFLGMKLLDIAIFAFAFALGFLLFALVFQASEAHRFIYEAF